MGEWGTVCDDSWDLNDARVVCRSLGYSGASEAPHKAHYGQGTGRIILDDLVCSGSESSLYACSHSGLYVHNCGHWEDASAVCELHMQAASCRGALIILFAIGYRNELMADWLMHTSSISSDYKLLNHVSL